jgi:hypothetical protein
MEAYVYPLLAPFLLFLHHDHVHQCIASFIYLWCFELKSCACNTEVPQKSESVNIIIFSFFLLLFAIVI